MSVTVTATAAGNRQRSTVICHRDNRRTVVSNHTSYFIRDDVFGPRREVCIALRQVGVGFTVVTSRADSRFTDAYPEVVYGCAWGVCTPQSLLPRRVFRLRHVVTWLATNWSRVPGKFNVAWDIWFGHEPTTGGQAQGAEVMIWIGTKGFTTPWRYRIVRIDGYRWFYARHLSCNRFGCWNYVLFRKVVPAAIIPRLWLLPFFRYAEKQRQLKTSWFLKSIDAGFEIWRHGQGLAIRSFSVGLRLARLRR